MATSALRPDEMQRLAFIRLHYQQGLDQSRLPEPLSFTSILAFHDSAESFLILVSEHLGITVNDHHPFIKKWFEGLSPDKHANGVDLAGKFGIKRLTDLRNGFKHAGTLPGSAAVEQARTDVTNFFEENTLKVFGIPFADIDLTDLITHDEARKMVKAAISEYEGGNHIEGMSLLSEAFTVLFDGHTRQRSFSPSPYSFGPGLSYPLDERKIAAVLWQPDHNSRRNVPVRGSETLAKQISTITDMASQMQAGMRILALGVEFHRYVRFQELVPEVAYTADGARHVLHENGYQPNRDEFEYCRAFVLTVSLRLSEVEAHSFPPSWRTTP